MTQYGTFFSFCFMETRRSTYSESAPSSPKENTVLGLRAAFEHFYPKANITRILETTGATRLLLGFGQGTGFGGENEARCIQAFVGPNGDYTVQGICGVASESILATLAEVIGKPPSPAGTVFRNDQ